MDDLIGFGNPARELAECVSVPFERARSMPKSIYVSEEFLDLEIQNIFRKEWFCIGVRMGFAIRATISPRNWPVSRSWWFAK